MEAGNETAAAILVQTIFLKDGHLQGILGEQATKSPAAAAEFLKPFYRAALAMIAVAVSTLATNIAANIVSPANDFANLSPSRINFRTGGFITGIIGILIFPWKLIADPGGYIFTWLVGYSSLLGPVGGVLIFDYYFIRRQQLAVDQLYMEQGIYSYSGGFNRLAIVALLLGIAPNIPGFLTTTGVIGQDSIPQWISQLYNYAWFVGFFVSGISYYLLMRSYALGVMAGHYKKEDNYVAAD